MVVEKQLLPNAALKSHYGKVAWLYVYNTFKKTPDDNAATRIRLRFSVSSWPQLLLVDPSTMTVIGNTGRSVASFTAAVDRAVIGKADTGATTRLAAAEKLATQLQAKHPLKLARKGLDHADIVVRALALESLARSAPALVVARADSLLAVPNDAFRYSVCQTIAKAAKDKMPIKPAVVIALEKLVDNPANSRNPNVLRIRAVQALGACGRLESIALVAKHAITHNYRNGLTRIAVNAVSMLGSKHPKGKRSAVDALRSAFPPPATDARMARACTGLAKAVHGALRNLTGRKVAFPASYDARTRAELIKAFR